MLLRAVSPVIHATPADVFAFFAGMEENYLRWHPDHVMFRWIGEPGLKEGARFCFEERIGGKLLGKSVVFTRIVPGELIEFALANPLFRLVLPRISFRIEPEPDGLRVVQEIPIRTGPVGAWLNRREFTAVRVHMREEGERLRDLLEAKKA